MKFLASFVFLIGCAVSSLFGQNEKKVDQTPARISTNVTVPKQTQGATFGERVNSGPNKSKAKIEASQTFAEPLQIEVFSNGERDARNNVVVEGLTVSGTVKPKSGSLSGGAGGGAAAASYAATGRMAASNVKITVRQAETGDEASAVTDENGNFSVTLSRDTLHTIYVNEVEYGKVKLMKSKHDTVKNSINNVR
jgi:hypothetical protein